MIIADKNALAKNIHKKRCDLEKLSHIFFYIRLSLNVFFMNFEYFIFLVSKLK